MGPQEWGAPEWDASEWGALGTGQILPSLLFHIKYATLYQSVQLEPNLIVELFNKYKSNLISKNL